MQNIQDLQEKIFSESKNILGILNKINDVDELLSKQDLIGELAERISFLKLLKNKVAYYQNSELPFSATVEEHTVAETLTKSQDFYHEVTEEEAIFNNELNEIGESENNLPNVMEEEAIFNNQLNEIVENEFHENMIHRAEEEQNLEDSELSAEENTLTEIVENNDEESIFNHQLTEIDEDEVSEETDDVLSFVDEDRILEDSVPEDENDHDEEIFDQKVTEEEAVFNNQLNEIDEFENEISDETVTNPFEEEEQIQNNHEAVKANENSFEKIVSMFEADEPEEDILIEESENESVFDDFKYDEDQIITENSNVESIVAEIKKDAETENQENTLAAENVDRRKIVEIDRPLPETEKEKPASDESFENLDAYHQEKKIRLANIKGLKTIQTLFDDDHLMVEIPKEKTASAAKEDTGSILKTNIPTEYMEAEKQKPEFRLDLNDRMAFTKLLFGGSQTDLNNAVAELNRCRNLEEAKEYLSDLYYDRKWNKVDEYAQRLWILVENKFL